MAGDARDGLEGLASAYAQQPALILMDIQLPGMSGLEVLRANTRTSRIPIIVLNALVMPGDRERCLAAGADAYLAKPVSNQILLSTIAQLLGRA